MKMLKVLMSFLPSPLPVGMTEFETWAQSIRDIAGPGLENVPQDQFRWVLSSAIQHLKHTESSVPKRYFVHVIRKGAATQIAGAVFMEVKLSQEKAMAEAKAAQQKLSDTADLTAEEIALLKEDKQAEATAHTAVDSNVEPKA
jgi:hypothetical protein